MQGLLVDTRDGRRRNFRWSAGTVRFGSGVDADLVLSAPGIASRHGAFQLSTQGCHVLVEPDAEPIDLNGNATRDSAIRVGDVVRIGPFQLAFAESTVAAPAPRAAPAAAAPAPAPVRVAAPVATAEAAAPHALRKTHESTRLRAKLAGQGVGAEGMKTAAIITGLIAIGVIGFMFFGGNPWAGLADGSQATRIANVRVLMKNCEFSEAESRLADLYKQTSDPEVVKELDRAKKEIADARATYARGEQELEVLAQKIGTMPAQNFEMYYANRFINDYRSYEPLCKKADKLIAMAKAGVTPPPSKPAGEADDGKDYSGQGAAPGFANRKTKPGDH